jgi:hypothetical protein
MARLDVKSREYKVMLLPDAFAGSEAEVRRATDRFWAEVGKALEQHDIPTEGAFDEVKAHRRIKFFDTEAHGFNASRYVFRERIDVDSGGREVTLKYRHPDRYVASDRDMDAKVEREVETKFEEDIKPPFVSVFSYSTSVGVDADTDISKVKDVVELFPGLKGELRDVEADGELTLVRVFCARELVLVGAFLLLGRRDIEAKCAMVIWHDAQANQSTPVCVEFSFKYGDDDEDYQGTVTRDAHDVLQTLNAELKAWVHPDPKTKTALVYG